MSEELLFWNLKAHYSVTKACQVLRYEQSELVSALTLKYEVLTVATLRTIRITVFCNVVLCNLVGQVPTFLLKINTYLSLNLNIFIDLVLSEVPQPSKIMYSIFIF